MKPILLAIVVAPFFALAACNGDEGSTDTTATTSAVVLAAHPTIATPAGPPRRMTPAEEKAMNDEIAAQKRANSGGSLHDVTSKVVR